MSKAAPKPLRWSGPSLTEAERCAHAMSAAVSIREAQEQMQSYVNTEFAGMNKANSSLNDALIELQSMGVPMPAGATT